MSDIKHTPGPWHLVKSQRANGKDYSSLEWLICGAAGAPVITRRGIAKPTKLDGAANARLITASPDLYRVATTAPILSKYHGMRGFEVMRFIADYEAWNITRRAALAVAFPTSERGEA